MHRLATPLAPLILAAAFLFAAPAQAVLHIIQFDDPNVTGSFDVDITGLNPGDQVNCNNGASNPNCAFDSFEVSYAGSVFDLLDVNEVLIGVMGTNGIEGLFALLLDTAGTATDAELDMSANPNTWSINPNGSYTITVVPEPGTALLLGLGLTSLAAGRRR